MKNLLRIAATALLAGGVILGGAGVASAEPSPGMHRSVYHCHFFTYPLYTICHTH